MDGLAFLYLHTSVSTNLQADILELEDLVEALLESARLNRGAVPIQRTSQHVYSLLIDALAKVDVEEREVCLEVDSDLYFSLDKRLIMRLLINLLSSLLCQ